MKPGKIIKWILILFAAAVIVFLLARIFMQGRNNVLTDITPTDKAVSAYKADSDAFSTCKIQAEISNDGYFSAYSLVWCEDTGELQLTARYNDSLYNYLGVDEDADFSWELRNSDGDTISLGKAAGSEKSYIYNYTRLIFDNVEIDEEQPLYLQLVCEECGYPTESTKALKIHAEKQRLEGYRLSKSEKASLSAK